MLVHEIEHARDTLVMSIGEEGVGWQVRDALLNRIRDDTASAGDRLPSALEHEGKAHRQTRPLRPEARIGVRGIDGRRRGAGVAGQAACSECDGGADGLESLSAVEMRGLLRGIDHSRLRLRYALSI